MKTLIINAAVTVLVATLCWFFYSQVYIRVVQHDAMWAFLNRQAQAPQPTPEPPKK